MLSKKMIESYAKLAVQCGVNIQKGQLLVIKAPVEAYEFARLCQSFAYEAGAGEVMIQYEDQYAHRADIEHEQLALLKQVPQWVIECRREVQERGCAFLHIDSGDPELMRDVDPKRLALASASMRQAMKPYQSYTMNNIGQWCVIAVPNPAWAKKIYPDETEERAMEFLWRAILKTVHVSDRNDPTAVWKAHVKEIRSHCRVMNRYAFKSLHFVSELGTDLTVQLPEGHLWGGGDEVASGNGCRFNPNLPTEEVFTTPDRWHVDGIVYSSKPLSHNGRIIENFWLKFKDGEVVDFKARTGNDALAEILKTDAGSRRLGEVALISYQSPISKLNMLFYDTLFDENASCHLALGACYPTQLKGGADMSERELISRGGNVSAIHVDFMFGTRLLNVTGITKTGKEIQVFQHGNFMF